jgi:hypothetical protein
MNDARIERWRQLAGEEKTWVLFAHGTCVVLDAPADDPVVEACGALSGWAVDAELGEDRVTLSPVPEGGWVAATVPPRLRAFVDPDDLPPRPEAALVAREARGIFAADARRLEAVYAHPAGSPLPGDVA